MTKQSCAKVTGATVILLAIAFAGISIKAPRVQASADDTDARVRIGFQIAPVPLNLDGKDPALVGLGSYLVNAIGDCNGCHSSGAPPLGFYNFVTGRNPYFNQPAKVDPTVYLNGGANFGTLERLPGRMATPVRPLLPGTLHQTRMGGQKAVTLLPSSSRS